MRSVSLVGEERVDDKRPRRVGNVSGDVGWTAEDFEILSKRTQLCPRISNHANAETRNTINLLVEETMIVYGMKRRLYVSRDPYT